MTGVGYSNAVVALDPKTLKVKDWFTATNAMFTSTPTIFTYKGHEILAAATKDGRVFLLDTTSLGGADHKTPLFISAATTTLQGFSPSALATWEDSAQNRWLLAPAAGAKGSVAALKVTGGCGQSGAATGVGVSRSGFARGANSGERSGVRALHRRIRPGNGYGVDC